jgi:hypothetical protein
MLRLLKFFTAISSISTQKDPQTILGNTSPFQNPNEISSLGALNEKNINGDTLDTMFSSSKQTISEDKPSHNLFQNLASIPGSGEINKKNMEDTLNARFGNCINRHSDFTTALSLPARYFFQNHCLDLYNLKSNEWEEFNRMSSDPAEFRLYDKTVDTPLRNNFQDELATSPHLILLLVQYIRPDSKYLSLHSNMITDFMLEPNASEAEIKLNNNFVIETTAYLLKITPKTLFSIIEKAYYLNEEEKGIYKDALHQLGVDYQYIQPLDDLLEYMLPRLLSTSQRLSKKGTKRLITVINGIARQLEGTKREDRPKEVNVLLHTLHFMYLKERLLYLLDLHQKNKIDKFAFGISLTRLFFSQEIDYNLKPNYEKEKPYYMPDFEQDQRENKNIRVIVCSEKMFDNAYVNILPDNLGAKLPPDPLPSGMYHLSL